MTRDDDHELAADLAERAGRLLQSLRATGPTSSLAKLGDRSSQELLASDLAAARPDDAVLSEEAADDDRRLSSPRVWIVDPLDGTREFSEGRDDWAVHVALWQEGRLAAGAVAVPDRDVLLATPRLEARPAPEGQLRIAVSRSRPPAVAIAMAERLGGALVPLGSAGVKVAAVVSGEVHAYVHAGGQYEWDSAAPVAVALAAGLHASRLDGSPLTYNAADPYLPDLLVCRPELVTDLLLVGNAAATLHP